MKNKIACTLECRDTRTPDAPLFKSRHSRPRERRSSGREHNFHLPTAAESSAALWRIHAWLEQFCIGALAIVLLAGCASTPNRISAHEHGGSEEVKQRLVEIIDAAETKDLARLDRYHWYGPHFTKFASTGPRLNAAAAREGEHKGLSALTGLKLRTEDLQIDIFENAAVATFTMVATIPSAAESISKRERGTLIFVQYEGSWKIVHEHFSAAE